MPDVTRVSRLATVERLRDGIPLSAVVVEELRALARELGLQADLA
jgi:hypothetical protein